MTAGVSKIEQTLGPVASFNIVEMLLGIPQLTTVEAITYCKVLTISKRELIKLFKKFEEVEKNINMVLNTLDDYPVRFQCLEIVNCVHCLI